MLRSCKQQIGQSVDEYFQKLKQLSSDCDFGDVAAQVHKQEAIRDAFISGLASSELRQRLLEDRNLIMQTAFDRARSLEIAQKNAQQYEINLAVHPSTQQIAAFSENRTESQETQLPDIAAANVSQKCSYCGNRKHSRRSCPARYVECYRCSKLGHFAKVCRSNGSVWRQQQTDTCASVMKLTQNICSLNEPDQSHNKVNISIKINGVHANALVDTGSTLSHLSDSFRKRLKLKLQNSNQSIGLAVKDCSSSSVGTCKVKVELKGESYDKVPMTVLKHLLADAILGQDLHGIMELHQSVNIHFGGFKPALHLGALQPIKTSTPVKLFEHLKNNCIPIATRERRYSMHDKKFISTEVKRLLADDLIEPSHSPWRAQPFIITPENHRKRMVIDCSQTINKFTQLDAYPLPLMQDVVKQVAQYKIYSTLDMSSAYHQIELPESERIYTAFQADGSLWQWK